MVPTACSTSRNEGYLPSQRPEDKGKKTLLLDLDETLVHTEFNNDSLAFDADLILCIGNDTGYVCFRPGARTFIEIMSKYYELVVFTASKSGYANPVISRLFGDIFTHRLFREHCSET